MSNKDYNQRVSLVVPFRRTAKLDDEETLIQLSFFLDIYVRKDMSAKESVSGIVSSQTANKPMTDAEINNEYGRITVETTRDFLINAANISQVSADFIEAKEKTPWFIATWEPALVEMLKEAIPLVSDKDSDECIKAGVRLMRSAPDVNSIPDSELLSMSFKAALIIASVPNSIQLIDLNEPNYEGAAVAIKKDLERYFNIAVNAVAEQGLTEGSEGYIDELQAQIHKALKEEPSRLDSYADALFENTEVGITVLYDMLVESYSVFNAPHIQ